MRRMRRKGFVRSDALLALALAALLAGLPAVAQKLPSGPQVLTFHSDVDDAEQPYAVYLPRGYDPAKRYPLVVSLHGAGSNHRLNLRRVFGKSNAEGETDVEASRYFPEWADVEYIVASPYARGTMGYQGVAEKDVLDVLADVRRRFSVDDDRTYLTGLSMGGGGTLWIGLTRPDVWAAIAPVCPAPPPGTEVYAPNALSFPVLFVQGSDDPVVKPEGVREWAERLKGLGTQVEYEEYDGVGHFSWVPAYADGRIFDWFGRYRRDPHPDRVRFSSDRYKYDRAFWVRLDGLTPGRPASIDARFTDVNQIEVSTDNLDGFTLEAAGHPRFRAGESLTVRVDGRELTLPGSPELSFHRGGEGKWAAGREDMPDGAKRRGLEGPMSEVISERHVYVYGTADDPAEPVAAERRAVAVKAAEWSVYRGEFLGRVMVFPRVLADREVRPSDLESAHLVLFGTRETNRLIARFADRLPLHLDPAADDYGLSYVYPIDGRYVLINSGLPWWTSSEPQMIFGAGIPAFALIGRGDFLLFRGGAEMVVSEGRFDRLWRLPEAAGVKLRESGVVTVSAR